MTAKAYLRHAYHRIDSGFKKIRRLLNPAKFYSVRTLTQIKTREKASVTLKRTPNIVVEINNTCNLNCIMCETKNSKRPKGVMSVDDFVWILDKIIKPKGQRVLVVHTVGEPLMHPHFDKIADEVYKRNIRLLLTTNGLFLKKYSRVFEKYPGLFAGINVSVDGASKETYDKI
ncbi:MAG: radical SAM protein, partial [Nitrospirota bacterium]